MPCSSRGRRQQRLFKDGLFAKLEVDRYHIDYERDAEPSRRGGDAAFRMSDGPPQRLRVRHAASGARIACRSRRARAQSLSLDPVELFTSLLPDGLGLNVLHLHVNALGDDATVAVVDLRAPPPDGASARQRAATPASEGDDDALVSEEIDTTAARLASLKREPFATDASGRQLDYKIVSDGSRVVAVLVAPERDGELAGDAPFREIPVPHAGDLVELPEGALGILRGPPPLGLVISHDEDAAAAARSARKDDGLDASMERDGFGAKALGPFRDHRCRNCGSKCPEALPGLLTVDVISTLVAPPATDDKEVSHTAEDDADAMIRLTQEVDDDALGAARPTARGMTDRKSPKFRRDSIDRTLESRRKFAEMLRSTRAPHA